MFWTTLWFVSIQRSSPVGLADRRHRQADLNRGNRLSHRPIRPSDTCFPAYTRARSPQHGAPMTISERAVGGVTILDVQGNLTLGACFDDESRAVTSFGVCL
jgi:hypothetical protein